MPRSRNKINHLGQDKVAYSIEEQEKNKSKDWTYCLWMDGMTYCDSFNASSNEYPHVLLHKTFVPYWKGDSVKDDTCIGEDQLRAITSKLNKLFNLAKEEFPKQYECYNLEDSEYIIMHHKIGNSIKCDYITHVQDTAMNLLQNFETNGYIHIDRNCVPKYPYKEINMAKESLENLCTNQSSLDDCEIAKYLLCVSACLWWHLRVFEVWYKESGMIKNLKDDSILKVIRLMRGKTIVDKINLEKDLLAQTCEYLKNNK